MKNLFKNCLTICFLFICTNVFAQTASDDPQSLVKQGIALNDAGRFAEAIDKYDQAIKTDPNFAQAYYEKSYTLIASGKGKDAVPILEKLLTLDPTSGGAFDMLGTVYDDDHQPDKAIDYYKKGIAAAPGYQRLHYNLAIAYLRQGKLAESEACSIDAIKLDPKHASSMRVYALATYREQKRDCSLLAWCSFILLEPQTQRSTEAYKYIKTILNYGITKTGEKSINISVNPNDVGVGNMSMQLAVIAATEGKTNLSRADSLSLQLKEVFKITGEMTAKQPAFYVNYFTKYFGNLAATDNVPAFARLVGVTVNADDRQWFKDHPKELDELNKWTQVTAREF